MVFFMVKYHHEILLLYIKCNLQMVFAATRTIEMSYQRLSEISDDLILGVSDHHYIRSELSVALEPPYQNVTILKGARGVGKSTLLQQFLLKKRMNGCAALYISADSTLLTSSLAEFAHEYYKRAGQYLAIDEIHKYENWQAELKTILDAFPALKVMVSGSSSLNLDYASTDLSRRHVMLHAKGLSFREYVNKHYNLNVMLYSLNDILSGAEEISVSITRIFRENKCDLLTLFRDYLRSGYFLTRDNYPTEMRYYDSLINSVNSVIDSDLSAVHKDIDSISREKIKRLLKHLSLKCPFTPNVAELSRQLSIPNDNSLKKYLYYLSEAEVLTNLYPRDKSTKDFQRPQKIFLNNTNFAYAYSTEPEIGSIRETFAANCLQNQGELTVPTFGDFCLDGEYTFEIGGRSKNKRQIKSIKNSYVFVDDILSVENDKLPLWLLGFLW